MENGNVINLFKHNTKQVKTCVEIDDYQTILENLALRISDHYHHVTSTNQPIDLDHASENDQILLSIANKFGIGRSQILEDLEIIIAPLLNKKTPVISGR